MLLRGAFDDAAAYVSRAGRNARWADPSIRRRERVHLSSRASDRSASSGKWRELGSRRNYSIPRTHLVIIGDRLTTLLLVFPLRAIRRNVSARDIIISRLSSLRKTLLFDRIPLEMYLLHSR